MCFVGLVESIGLIIWSHGFIFQEIHTCHILFIHWQKDEKLGMLGLNARTCTSPHNLWNWSWAPGPNVSGFIKLWCTTVVTMFKWCARELELVHQIQVVFTCTTLPPGFLWQTLSLSSTIDSDSTWISHTPVIANRSKELQWIDYSRSTLFWFCWEKESTGAGKYIVYILAYDLVEGSGRWQARKHGDFWHAILFHVFCLWDVLPIAFYEYWFHLWLLESKTLLQLEFSKNLPP